MVLQVQHDRAHILQAAEVLLSVLPLHLLADIQLIVPDFLSLVKLLDLLQQLAGHLKHERYVQVIGAEYLAHRLDALLDHLQPLILILVLKLEDAVEKLCFLVLEGVAGEMLQRRILTELENHGFIFFGSLLEQRLPEKNLEVSGFILLICSEGKVFV